MKRKFNFLIVSTLVLFFVCLVSRAESKGMDVPGMGVGARPLGLGKSFVAVADDANTIFWNPAGITNLAHPQLTTQYSKYFAETNYGFLGLALPDKSFGLGLGVIYFNSQDIPVTQMSSSGQLIETAKTFGVTNSAFFLSTSLKLAPYIHLGVSAKGIHETLRTISGLTISADVGILIGGREKVLTLGAVVRNLTGKRKFMQDEEPLPIEFSAGLSLRPFKNEEMLLSADYRQKDEKKKINLGAEILLGNFLGLRGGYIKALSEDEKEGCGPTAGMTLNSKSFSLDYAWVPHKELGATHWVSLNLKFAPTGLPPAPPTVAPIFPKPEQVPVEKSTVPQSPKEKVSIAIMDLGAQGVSSMDAIVISDLLRTAIINTNVFTIVERGKLEQVMSELGFQQTGCTEQECAIKVGKMLNAQKTIVGTVGRLGQLYFINIRLVDTETAKVEYADKGESATLEDTRHTVEELANHLAQRVSR